MALKPDEILEELEQEMSRGRVYEASLRSDIEVVHGLQEGEDIFIDPRNAVLGTLWHELTHRRWPKKSETQVIKLEQQLLAHADEATKIRWWKAYKKIVKKRMPVDVEGD